MNCCRSKSFGSSYSEERGRQRRDKQLGLCAQRKILNDDQVLRIGEEWRLLVNRLALSRRTLNVKEEHGKRH